MMTEPTAQEVLMWALINQARLDPAGIAASYNIDLNEGPVKDFNGNVVTLTPDSKQPLAWNSSLFAAAHGHSQDMMDSNFFGHYGPQPGSTPQSRAIAAGYQPSPNLNVGENIDLIQNSAAIDPTQAIYQEFQNLFVDKSVDGRGHRFNILYGDYQEVGVGQVLGPWGGFNASDITQDFGKPAAGGQFLTGIAYNDPADGNHPFYSVGSGRGGINVATSAWTVGTGTPGQYSHSINAGVQTVTFSAGDLVKPVSVSINVTAGKNALVDLINQSTVETSVSLTALDGVNGVTKIIGLGNTGLTLTGNSGDNIFVTPAGNNTIDGGGGTDTVVFSGNKASYTIISNANGTVTVSGANLTDTLISIEKLQFDDQTVNLVAPPPPANHPPVVTAHDVTVAANAAVALSSLFTAHDQDGDNTITQYVFMDDGSGGHFTRNGVTLAAHTVDHRELGRPRIHQLRRRPRRRQRQTLHRCLRRQGLVRECLVDGHHSCSGARQSPTGGDHA
jgi:hypothetical protein